MMLVAAVPTAGHRTRHVELCGGGGGYAMHIESLSGATRDSLRNCRQSGVEGCMMHIGISVTMRCNPKPREAHGNRDGAFFAASQQNDDVT